MREGDTRGARLWWGVLPHGGLHGEGHEVQVAVVGQVAGPEAGLSDLVPGGGGGFAQELGAGRLRGEIRD